MKFIIYFTFLLFIINGCGIFESQDRKSYFEHRVQPLINKVNKESINRIFGKPNYSTVSDNKIEWDYWYYKNQNNDYSTKMGKGSGLNKDDLPAYDCLTFYFDSTDTLRSWDVSISSVEF